MRQTALALLLTVLTAGVAHANLLFSDDFESYDPDTKPSWTVTNNHTFVTADDGSVFGSSNQYMDLEGLASVSGHDNFHLAQNLSGMVGEIVSFSFDFFEPANIGNAAVNVGFAAHNGDLNNDAAARITLNNGNLGFAVISGLTADPTPGFSYNTDQAYRITMISNDTDSAFSFGSQTIGAERYGVWFDDVFAGQADMRDDRDPGRIGFRKFNTGTQQVFVDNVEVSVIPEPSTLVLLGLSLTALLGARRWKRN